MKRILLLLNLALTLPSITLRSSGDKRTDLFRAIREVESNGNMWAVGDDGMSIGPYQISYDYWLDACKQDPWLKRGSWLHCIFRPYAERTMAAYWTLYGPADPSYEQLARIHNGGPLGYKKPQTKAYWRRVQGRL